MRRTVLVCWADCCGPAYDLEYEVEAADPIDAGIAALDAAWADAARQPGAPVPAWPVSCDGVLYDDEIDWDHLCMEAQ